MNRQRPDNAPLSGAGQISTNRTDRRRNAARAGADRNGKTARGAQGNAVRSGADRHGEASHEVRGNASLASLGRWENLALFLTGILGLTALAGGIPNLILPLGRIAAAAVLTAVVLFLLYTSTPRLFYPAILTGAVVGLIWLFSHRSAGISELSNLFNWIYGTSESSTMTLSLTAVPMTVIAVLLLFLLEFPLGAHIILYALICALLTAAVAGGAQISLPAALLLGLFSIAAWAVRGRAGAAALFLPVFLAALFLVTLSGDRLYEAINRIDGAIWQMAGERFPNLGQEDPGLVNRGNNTQISASDFTLTTASAPEDSLYLSSFHGGTYQNSCWTAVESGADSSISGLYYNVIRKQGKNPNMATLSFAGQVQNLTPYFAEADSGKTAAEQTRKFFTWYDIDPDWSEDSSLAKYESTQKSYEKALRQYTAIPAGELPRLTELVQSTPLESRNEITAFILYTLQSRTEYTLSPGLAPAGKDIAEYFLFDSGKGYCQQYAATAVLMYRLYGIPARYVTGFWVSPDQFTVNENGSAVAHVTGRNSHAWPEIFIENYGWVPVEVTSVSSNGSDLIHPGLTVNDLHQIMREHGWEEDTLTERSGNPSAGDSVPESTASGTTSVSSAPETAQESSTAVSSEQKSAAAGSSGSGDQETMTAETAAGGAGQESSGSALAGTDGGGSRGAGEGEGGSDGSAAGRAARFLAGLLAATAAITVAAAGGLYWYTRRRSRELRQLDYLGLYTALTGMLREAGRLPEGDGTEKDYPERLHRAVPAISEEDAVRLREVTLQAAYGPGQPTHQDVIWLRRLYIAASREAAADLRGFAGVVFRLHWLPGIPLTK